MPVIHFEEADSPERTQIGEAIAKFARQATRLETGRSEESISNAPNLVRLFDVRVWLVHGPER